MTRVLKVPHLGAYVTRSGRCTRQFTAACQFKDVPSAVQFCRRHKLNRVELIMRTDAPEYDLSLPLSLGQ